MEGCSAILLTVLGHCVSVLSGVSSPEDVRPAVVVVAAHLQPHVQDGVHAQHVGRVQPHSGLRPGHLLQPLLDWTDGRTDSSDDITAQ